MAEHTEISWADATFNPWIGCARVSPACDGCYAAALMGTEGRMKRAEWGGPGKGVGTRTRTSPSNWKEPIRWERKQAALIEEYRLADPRTNPIKPKPFFVFCSSLADVFDNAVPTEWRRDLFDLIRATPHLTWLLLTKRPGQIVKLYGEAMLDPPDGGSGYEWPRNAAIGCTVVNAAEVDRDVPKLLEATRALKPAFNFLSMEPLLGAVSLDLYWHLPGIDWIIAGGETDQGDHKARPMHPEWVRDLARLASDWNVPFHFKQWGEWQPLAEGQPRKNLVEVSPEGLTRRDDGTAGFCRGQWMNKVGKNAPGGNILDGRLYQARPEPKGTHYE